MSDEAEEIKAKFRAVIAALSVDERSLFSEVLKIEHAHLSEKNPNLREDILKVVRQVIS
jgi:hypothetical protein